MHTTNTTPYPRLMHFVSLNAAAKQLGAASKRQFVADLRTLTHRERRDVADLVKKEA